MTEKAGNDYQIETIRYQGQWWINGAQFLKILRDEADASMITSKEAWDEGDVGKARAFMLLAKRMEHLADVGDIGLIEIESDPTKRRA